VFKRKKKENEHAAPI